MEEATGTPRAGTPGQRRSSALILRYRVTRSERKPTRSRLSLTHKSHSERAADRQPRERRRTREFDTVVRPARRSSRRLHTNSTLDGSPSLPSPVTVCSLDRRWINGKKRSIDRSQQPPVVGERQLFRAGSERRHDPPFQRRWATPSPTVKIPETVRGDTQDGETVAVVLESARWTKGYHTVPERASSWPARANTPDPGWGQTRIPQTGVPVRGKLPPGVTPPGCPPRVESHSFRGRRRSILDTSRST